MPERPATRETGNRRPVLIVQPFQAFPAALSIRAPPDRRRYGRATVCDENISRVKYLDSEDIRPYSENVSRLSRSDLLQRIDAMLRKVSAHP